MLLLSAALFFTQVLLAPSSIKQPKITSWNKKITKSVLFIEKTRNNFFAHRLLFSEGKCNSLDFNKAEEEYMINCWKLAQCCQIYHFTICAKT